MIDFKNIDYLKSGSPIQQQIYKALIELKFFPLLQAYNPILVGTFPIGINITSSDLDIVCQVKDFQKFTILLKENLQHHKKFSLKELPNYKGLKTLIVRFYYQDFPIEIFAQNKPSIAQDSYKHMLIEAAILQEKGENFKQSIIQLKQMGYKTEPAFAKLLALKGCPYEALLNYKV